MSNTQKIVAAAVATLIAAIGTAGIAIGDSEVETMSGADPVETLVATENKFADGSIFCEIQAIPDNGGVILEGLVSAETLVDGSYRFQVITSGRSGNSNVSQGGYFSAGPDQATTIGKVMVGNRGATYDINLEVTSDGETVRCTKHVDGVI